VDAAGTPANERREKRALRGSVQSRLIACPTNCKQRHKRPSDLTRGQNMGPNLREARHWGEGRDLRTCITGPDCTTTAPGGAGPEVAAAGSARDRRADERTPRGSGHSRLVACPTAVSTASGLSVAASLVEAYSPGGSGETPRTVRQSGLTCRLTCPPALDVG
jgi:hypothetical protein